MLKNIQSSKFEVFLGEKEDQIIYVFFELIITARNTFKESLGLFIFWPLASLDRFSEDFAE